MLLVALLMLMLRGVLRTLVVLPFTKIPGDVSCQLRRLGTTAGVNDAKIGVPGRRLVSKKHLGMLATFIYQ